jgi:hypothetical protein
MGTVLRFGKSSSAKRPRRISVRRNFNIGQTNETCFYQLMPSMMVPTHQTARYLKRFPMPYSYPALKDVLERSPLTIAPKTSVLKAIAHHRRVSVTRSKARLIPIGVKHGSDKNQKDPWNLRWSSLYWSNANSRVAIDFFALARMFRPEFTERLSRPKQR